MVGKANKGVNVEKNNRFLKVKNQNQKRKKKKIEEEKSSVELQKPNIEAEVYNNKKCD